MKAFIFALFFVSTVAMAEDTRQLAKLPEAAQESLRQEMLDNMVAVNEVLSLMAAGKVREAGEAAEAKLGMSAMGKHRGKPFDARPGPHMPPAMHGIGMDGHKAASEFAAAAKTGDRDKALALLPNITSACVGCHFSYRTR
ncbi:MAG: cytochrome C [Gammaproteobacteria bacterium]|jgi:cytochrome c556|nr:cytochrome C [Gammaproteobacteria bacterium]MBU1602993.1 cytochrome C [Gammaproteobacteria bacterium]MBU2434085.1 cytochrome C [Gammaproteobacteria bacterium]MBU2448562.1 cytochrome C [Gammaproteobacteria bacterium]PKO46704.1 MAG: cytochrome C [Betaproteobacteria bacterium HGW-Betaproteobacteria-4]